MPSSMISLRDTKDLRMDEKFTCVMCDKEFEKDTGIMITDHPDYHDGTICYDCYNKFIKE